MKKNLLNISLWLLFTLMQCGPVVGTLEYGRTGGPMEVLWLMVPFSLICLALVVATTGVAIPRLLLRRKWGRYVILEFCLAYVVSLIEQLLIAYIWTEWNIMPADHHLDYGWLAVNSLCNSLMLFFTLLAIGGWYLFVSARQDISEEKTLIGRIEGYIDSVRRLLRPEVLSRRLGEIAGKVESEPQEAEEVITLLASEIRESLYKLPMPPAVDDGDRGNRKDEISNDSGFNRWLISPRHRIGRVTVFQLSLIGICFGAFFATPDGPDFSGRLVGFFVLLAMFEIIAAIDIFVLFRSFRKTRRLRRFIWASGLLAAVMILPILLERIALYLHHPGNDALFILTTALATTASVLMIAFYIAGIGAVLLYQDWLRHTRRLILLQAATKRLEYAGLKKQINPHFLFNVLNNAGILTMLDAADAKKILIELRRLIDYQFRETEHPATQLSDTVSFLRSYLMLEASRREDFTFNLTCNNPVDGVEVPSLMFIPFVENAVKYAAGKSDGQTVAVTFTVRNSRLVFECLNPVDEAADTGNQHEGGGLGIANTLRRLELLYEDDFHYSAESRVGVYRVTLDIPLSTISELQS